MVELNVHGRTLVKTLKEQFSAAFGVELRVYHGKNFAADEDTLAHVRQEKLDAEININSNMHVGNLEEKFLEEVGLTVQVEDRFGDLAENTATIGSLDTAGDLNKISITGQKKLATIQTEFTKKYSKLGLYFFNDDEYEKSLLEKDEISPIESFYTLSKVRKVKNNEVLTITGNYKVGNFENKFHDSYGVNAQICYTDNEGHKYYTGKVQNELTLTALNKQLEEEGVKNFKYSKSHK